MPSHIPTSTDVVFKVPRFPSWRKKNTTTSTKVSVSQPVFKVPIGIPNYKKRIIPSESNSAPTFKVPFAVQNRRKSASQLVHSYTEHLARGRRQEYAIQRLLQINCSITVFEGCRTENILMKYCGQNEELEGSVALLVQKLAHLRRKEFSLAKENMEKNGKMTVNVSFKPEIVKMYQNETENIQQEVTNQLFSSVFKSIETKETSTVKPDYSKFKIVKRSTPLTASH